MEDKNSIKKDDGKALGSSVGALGSSVGALGSNTGALGSSLSASNQSKELSSSLLKGMTAMRLSKNAIEEEEVENVEASPEKGVLLGNLQQQLGISPDNKKHNEMDELDLSSTRAQAADDELQFELS